VNILELLDEIAAAGTVAEAWSLAAGHFRTLGFSRLNYGLSRFLTGGSIGDPEDALYLSTSDPAYAEFYIRDRFYETTPIYRWALAHTGATYWRWVHEAYFAGRLSPEEAEAVRINARHGITSGIAISFAEIGDRTRAVLGLTADRGLDHDDVDRIWERQRREITAVANMMHLRIATLPLPARRRPLTPRQREALQWVSDGKTAADIAVLMSVTPAMVEKHLRLARESLNVATTAHAVAKATRMNMIFARPAAPCEASVRIAGKESQTFGPGRNGAG